MKRVLIATVAMTLLLQGCMSTKTRTTTRAQNSGVDTTAIVNGEEVTVRRSMSCQAPVAKVSIAPMKCQAKRCSKVPQANGNMAVLLELSGQGLQDFSNLGENMTTMLSSAVAQTGCFELLDREAIEQVKEEMRLAGIDFTPETADFVLTGAVTSFEYEKKKTGLLGGSFTLGGAFENTNTTAKLGLDVRLINVNSTKVEYTKTYRSDATNDEYSFGVLGFGGGNGAAGGMSFGGSVEVEEAVRTVLNQSIHDLVKHLADGRYTVTDTATESD